MPIAKAKNPRVDIFAAEFVRTGNASEAYREAYPSSRKWKDKSVWTKASLMLADDVVRQRIEELGKRISERAVMTKADVLREAMRLAKFDVRKLYNPDGSPKQINELDDETAAAIQGIETMEEWDGSGPNRVFVGYTKKYKVADKNSALEKLFKHFGLFEADNKQRYADLSDEDIRKRLASKLTKKGA